MKLKIEHSTRYNYSLPLRSSIQYLRLVPRNDASQHVIDWWLSLPGNPPPLTDGYGNVMHVLTLDRPHQQILVEARGIVELNPNHDGRVHDDLDPRPFLRPTSLTTADEPLIALTETYLSQSQDVTALGKLQQAILEKMPYIPGSTEVWHSAQEAFALGSGVCQDHTHVMLACARYKGLPARYVSGYIHVADEGHLASHAWAEIWLDGAWQTFDVTNQLLRPNQHIKLAVGMDYLEACPIRGMRSGGGEETLHVHVNVRANFDSQ
ncbi:transglutaminase family protein [Phytohalomonas tamaricis]|uniref:transglutaminase family protein n=1 Tax=Phytohalomonas tamaricis TaxID=2081032 RepID=UPI000D0AD9D4|nr:transglutaminase family protein [Phytohalomonas tamaricis]